MADSDNLAALYARARELGGLIDLSDRAKWRLSGADRVRYLNGQVTNDIRLVRSDAALAACVTTAKGRLCGLVQVSAGPDFLRIDAECAVRDSLTARLERYIIADDASLRDVTDEECLFHLLPPALPGSLGSVETRTARRFGRPGVDIMAPRSEQARVSRDLAAAFPLLSPPVVESLRIEAGVPRWGAELTEETLPPEAGLDESAIDYYKGCYIGQEVISRIKSVGHVNRRLVGFISQEPLSAPMRVTDAADPEVAAGEITSATWSFGLETWVGLGYLKRGFEQKVLRARTAPAGAAVSVQARELPFIP
jgi:folate-binding protein YgfZ